MINALRSLLYSLIQLVFKNTPVPAPLDTTGIHRVLILRYDRLGDMVVTLPMIDILREYLPHATIDVLASPKNSELIRNDGRINNIYEWDGRLTSLPVLRNVLRAKHYDAVYCAVFFKLSAAGMLVNYLVGDTPVKIMQGNAAPEKLAQYHTWFNMMIDINASNQPMVQTLAEFAATSLGIDTTTGRLFNRERFKLPVSTKRKEVREQYGIPDSATCLFYNLSAGMPYREMSYEKNKQIVHYILNTYPDIYLLLNAVGAMRAVAERLSELSSRVHLPDADISLQKMMDAVHAADIVVTPDTSITHFATAHRKPAIVLCTPISSSAQWLPFNVPYRALFSEHDEGIEAIAADAVCSAFDDLVNEVANPLRKVEKFT
ncbi:MAG: glycosyltransferase family 9 protein [Candidatus Kapabacteria bacterium]|nr:glycosyltransferase family 9 protein [Candidatus Kapabacteria bacterium]